MRQTRSDALDAATWARIASALDELIELEPQERTRRMAQIAADDAAFAASLAPLLAAALAEELPLASPISLFDALSGDESPPDVVTSRAGERVGSFRLGEEIGRGGMGAVYAAERVDGDFQQRVAIKILKRGLDSEMVVRRFFAERRILGRLDHPGIARLIDGGLTGDGLPWFAMERVDGLSIVDYAAARGLSIHQRLELFVEVCEAVGAAHRALIVHRDLKPSNVLVRDVPGVRPEVKLLDFGIAKLLGEGEGDDATGTAWRPMTPQFAAPEQLAGGPITTLTDVWQLGGLLARLVAAPGLPRDLAKILEHARQPEPERRYASVDALAEDVRRFLDGRAVLARGDSSAYRLSRFVRRHRVLVGTVTTVTVALALGLAVALVQSRVAQREARRSKAVTDFLLATFADASPEVGRGERTTAREILDLGAARIDRDLAADRELRAELWQVVAGIEQELGSFTQARDHWRKALALQREAGREPGSIALAELGLTDALLETSELEEAEKTAQAAHEALLASSGPNRPEAWRALHLLGSVHRRQRRLTEAEGELRRALAELKRVLPADDAAITAAQDGLANAIFDQSRYAEAETLFRDNLARVQRTQGPDSVAAAQAWNDIALALDEGDQDSESETAYLRSLEIFRRRLSPDHPAIGRALKNLGALYDSMGRPADARRYLAEAADLAERTLGPDAYDTLSAVNTLAIVDYRLADYAAAETKLRRVLAGFRVQLGAENRDTQAAQSNLAAVLSEQRKFDEAAELQAEVVARRRETGTKDSLAVAVHVRGNILLRAGRSAEAIAAYDEALELRRQHFGADHPQVLVSLEGGIRARLSRGSALDRRQARDRVADGLALLERHPDVSAGVRGDLLVVAARVELADGKAESAAKRLEEAVRIRREANGERHWKVGEAALHLGRAFAALGRRDEARTELRRAVDIFAASPGRETLLAEARTALRGSGAGVAPD
jgi:eukaryotic-like serine/threonine-protein kinase